MMFCCLSSIAFKVAYLSNDLIFSNMSWTSWGMGFLLYSPINVDRTHMRVLVNDFVRVALAGVG